MRNHQDRNSVTSGSLIVVSMEAVYEGLQFLAGLKPFFPVQFGCCKLKDKFADFQPRLKIDFADFARLKIDFADFYIVTIAMCPSKVENLKG